MPIPTATRDSVVTGPGRRMLVPARTVAWTPGPSGGSPSSDVRVKQVFAGVPLARASLPPSPGSCAGMARGPGSGVDILFEAENVFVGVFQYLNYDVPAAVLSADSCAGPAAQAPAVQAAAAGPPTCRCQPRRRRRQRRRGRRWEFK